MAVKLFKFDGHNASAWIKNVNQFFSFERTHWHLRVPIAACYMEGEALIWFNKAQRSDFVTWEEFVEALQARFLEPFYSMDFELLLRQMEAINEKYKSINADMDARYKLKMRQLEEQHADRMKSIQEKYSMAGNFSSEFGNQDVGQDFVQEGADDMQFQKISDLVQEDEDDIQIQKIPIPLEGVEDQKVESCDDISQNMANYDEALDWFSGCESVGCKKLQLIPEKVEIKQEFKNKDLGEQDLVNKISNFGRCEVQLFDNTPQRKLDDGVFFLWCVRWCFDQGRKHFILARLRRREEEVMASCLIKWI
jgi:hypothetical protein